MPVADRLLPRRVATHLRHRKIHLRQPFTFLRDHYVILRRLSPAQALAVRRGYTAPSVGLTPITAKGCKTLPSLLPSFKGNTLFPPCSPWTPPQTDDLLRFLKAAQDPPHHIPAHPGAGTLQIRKAECSWEDLNGCFDQRGLRPSRGLHLTGAFFELAIGASQNRKEIIKPGNKLMPPLVLSHGALLQNSVVVLSRLFYEAIQTDVTPDLIAVLVKPQECE